MEQGRAGEMNDMDKVSRVRKFSTPETPLGSATPPASTPPVKPTKSTRALAPLATGEAARFIQELAKAEARIADLEARLSESERRLADDRERLLRELMEARVTIATLQAQLNNKPDLKPDA
jgi:hypothetical protein